MGALWTALALGAARRPTSSRLGGISGPIFVLAHVAQRGGKGGGRYIETEQREHCPIRRPTPLRSRACNPHTHARARCVYACSARCGGAQPGARALAAARSLRGAGRVGAAARLGLVLDDRRLPLRLLKGFDAERWLVASHGSGSTLCHCTHHSVTVKLLTDKAWMTPPQLEPNVDPQSQGQWETC